MSERMPAKRTVPSASCSGWTRWVRARVHPEQLADGTVRFAGILSDITEQHEADGRLRAALAELAAANGGWTPPTARRSSWHAPMR